MRIRFRTIPAPTAKSQIHDFAREAGHLASDVTVMVDDQTVIDPTLNSLPPGLQAASVLCIVPRESPPHYTDEISQRCHSWLSIYLKAGGDSFFVIDVRQQGEVGSDEVPFRTHSLIEALCGRIGKATTEINEQNLIGLAHPDDNETLSAPYHSHRQNLALSDAHAAERWLQSAWEELRQLERMGQKYARTLLFPFSTVSEEEQMLHFMKAVWPITDLGRLLSAYGVS